MEDIIIEHGLLDALDDRLMDSNCDCGFWLGLDDGPGGMDETSDCEDPEAEANARVDALQQESVDRQRFFDAIAGALDNRRVLTELERARMQLEDLRGRV